MKKIETIGDEANQQHTIIIDSGEITLTLRYYSVTQLWFMDVEYDDDSIYGVKLSLGVQHVNSKNWPFDFVVYDSSGEDVDPFQLTDFDDERCYLYMLEADEMEDLRGYSVSV